MLWEDGGELSGFRGGLSFSDSSLSAGIRCDPPPSLEIAGSRSAGPRDGRLNAKLALGIPLRLFLWSRASYFVAREGQASSPRECIFVIVVSQSAVSCALFASTPCDQLPSLKLHRPSRGFAWTRHRSLCPQAFPSAPTTPSPTTPPSSSFLFLSLDFFIMDGLI